MECCFFLFFSVAELETSTTHVAEIQSTSKASKDSGAPGTATGNSRMFEKQQSSCQPDLKKVRE